MKINKIILPAICALTLFGACTADYEKYNRNPLAIDEKEAARDGYDIASAMRAMMFSVISTDVNRCHQTDILLGGAYGRYSSESKANSWPSKFSTFDAPDGWSGVMFNEVIPYLYPSYWNLLAVTKDSVALSIGDVLKVLAMHRVTDTYGPIPYSKIGLDGAVQAPYDSQRDVYMKMFDELDGAIRALTARQTESISPNADIIYYGDLTKWIRLANSLKLRLAMRIVNVEPAIAREKAEQAVNHPVGVMASNADNAALRTFGVDGNPINVAVKYNDGDNRSSADMTAYMNAYSDPRMAAYFMESGFAKGTYVGYRCGILVGGVTQFQNYSIFKIDRTTPLQWMNVAEVMFLRAEGALRGWNMGGKAQDFYNSGITLSFDQWGVSGANVYLNNATGFPNGYNDPSKAYSYNSRLTDVTVKWSAADESNFERSLERIIIQKWLANFPLGHEAWADRRRTGYPVVMPVVTNNSPNRVLANDDVPRRLPYPAQEAVTNGANYKAAVQMLGGPDNIATRVWWDPKVKTVIE